MVTVEEQVKVIFEAQGAEKFSKAVDDSELALRRMARSIDEHVRELQKELLALKAMENPNNKRIASIQKEIAESRIASQALKSRVAALRDEEKAVRSASQATDDLTKKLLAQSVAVVGTGAAFAGIGFGVQQAIKQFGDFERTLNTIQAVSNATVGEIDAIKKSSLDLGAKTVFSNQQVAESYLELARAGFSTQESLAAMPGLLTLAAAAGGDLGSAANITAGILRGFNKDASESGHVADVLAQAANVSAGEITDFGMALKQLAPVALSSNQSLEDMTGLLAVLSNRMINGSDAGTDLKAILIRLVTPETQKMIKSLGVQVTDTSGKIRPLIDIVEQLQSKFKNLNQAGQLQVASKIAGVENVKSLLALINTSQSELEEFTNKMKSADGQAQIMADTINQGVNTAIEQFGGAVETLAASLGQKLAPAFIALTNTAIDLINAFSKNDGLQTFTIGAVSATAVAGALAAGLMLIPPALAAVEAGAVALAGILGVSTGGLSWILGGLVVAGGAYGLMLEQNTERQRAMAQTTLELRGEIDRVTDTSIRERNEAVKLAKEYDELTKKKSLTKGESQRLADIADTVISKLGLEGQSVEELARKYGSLTAAIQAKTLALAADERRQAITDKLKQTQEARKFAKTLVESETQYVNNPFSLRAARGESLSEAEAKLNKTKANYARLKRVEENLKNQLGTVDADTAKIADAINNPKPSKLPPPSGSQNAPSTAKAKKPKKGKSLAQTERERIRDVLDELNDQNAANDANLGYSRAFAAKLNGGETTQVQDFTLRKVFLQSEKAKLDATQVALDAFKPKTKEGVKAQAEALQTLDAELTKYQTKALALDNDVQKFYRDLGEKQREFIDEFRRNAEAFELNQLKSNQDEQAKDLQVLYNKQLITAEEYYGALAEASEFYHRAEIGQIDAEIESTNKRIKALTPLQVEQGKQLELSARLTALEQARAKATQEMANSQADITRQYKQDVDALALSLKQQTQQAISGAISDAFTGQGIVPAMKKFGTSLRDIIVNAFADALSKRVTKGFDFIFDSLAGAIKKVQGVPSAGGASGVRGGSIGGLSKTQAGLAVLGTALYAGGQFVGGSSKGAGRSLGGVALGAGGGALTGAMLGQALIPIPGVGTAIGAIAGGYLGGVSTAAGNANKLGFFSTKKGQALAYALFGLGGLFTLGAGKKRRAAERAEYQQNTLQPYLDSLVNGANANDLTDLISRRTQAGRGKPGRGSNGRRAKEAAMAELDKLIEQRRATIADAIKSLKKDTAELQFQIDTFGLDDTQKAAAQYKHDLDTLAQDTKDLLEQFKDSEEAKTEILKNESAKRQLIEKQTQQIYEDSAKDLEDLFKQRDEISNRNVFTRAKSTEQTKADDLAALDKDIAKALLGINDLSALGLQLPNVAGINQYLDLARQTPGNADIQILINGTSDPNAVAEEVKRQLQTFFRKYYGATA